MITGQCILSYAKKCLICSFNFTFSCPTPGSLRKPLLLVEKNHANIPFFPLVNCITFPSIYQPAHSSKRCTRVKRWSGKTNEPYHLPSVHVHVHVQRHPKCPPVSSSPHHTRTRPAKPVSLPRLFNAPSPISPPPSTTV